MTSRTQKSFTEQQSERTARAQGLRVIPAKGTDRRTGRPVRGWWVVGSDGGTLYAVRPRPNGLTPACTCEDSKRNRGTALKCKHVCAVTMHEAREREESSRRLVESAEEERAERAVEAANREEVDRAEVEEACRVSERRAAALKDRETLWG